MMQPGMRNYLGQILITAQEANQYELALGTRGRSGEQFDIWQAVYSPAGDDGYPKPIFDKETGDIDHSVAAHWKDHYDLYAMASVFPAGQICSWRSCLPDAFHDL
jgi:hypothetical protein